MKSDSINVIQHNERIIPFAHHPLALIRYVESLGYGSEKLLQNTDISSDYTHCSQTNISYNQYAQLINNAKSITKNNALGLTFGEQLGFSAHGMIGIGLLSSSTLYQALSLAVEYKRAISVVTHIELHSHPDTGKTSITVKPALDAGELVQFFMETICSCFNYCGKFLTKSESLPVEFHFNFPAPDVIDEYREFLGPDLYFNAPVTKMVCDRKMLDVNLPNANASTQRETSQFMQQTLSTLEVKEGFLTVMRQRLQPNEGHFPSLSAIAFEMNTSVSTLKRKLKQHNTSYQELLDDIRKELACNYLIENKLPITDIAEKLQYAETCSFRRAFKKWTNYTPKEYQRKFIEYS